MTDTALMQTDLDRLTERVEQAAQLVQTLRAEQEKLGREKAEIAQRLEGLEHQLQGQDVTALLQELATLRRESKEWQTERREVASRVESMLRKLERLEA